MRRCSATYQQSFRGCTAERRATTPRCRDSASSSAFIKFRIRWGNAWRSTFSTRGLIRTVLTWTQCSRAFPTSCRRTFVSTLTETCSTIVRHSPAARLAAFVHLAWGTFARWNVLRWNVKCAKKILFLKYSQNFLMERNYSLKFFWIKTKIRSDFWTWSAV